MKVYILFECTDQQDFTEDHCYCSAAPAREVVGVYDEFLKANEEKERREAVMDTIDDEGDGSAEIYYEIESYTVE